ncbi:unnamed protein product, partial [Ascophyllum nodosum]
MATLDVNGMKLRIESALWRSQYSDVYKVVDDRNQDVYALKVVRIPESDHDAFQTVSEWVMAEQNMVRSLPMDHANIIKFFYAGVGVAEKKMVCFILSEFCPDKVWNMGPGDLSEKRILQIFRDVLMGLLKLHSQEPPVAYRRIMGGDLFIGEDGMVKLGHFRRCSTVHRAYHSAEEIQSARLEIKRNTAKESRAPEQVDFSRGYIISEKVDIWALGVLLFRLAFFRSPFEELGSEAEKA